MVATVLALNGKPTASSSTLVVGVPDDESTKVFTSDFNVVLGVGSELTPRSHGTGMPAFGEPTGPKVASSNWATVEQQLLDRKSTRLSLFVHCKRSEERRGGKE